MGKRELLLLVVFVVLGVGVYQVTAPAAPADAQPFSFERLVQFAKAHFHGPRERRTVHREAALTPDAEVKALHVGEFRGVVLVEGSDGPGIQIRLESNLAGIDAHDLDLQDKAVSLAVEREGDAVAVRVTSDPDRRPRGELHITLPRGLKVQITGRTSAEVRGTAGLHLVDYQGELTAAELAGPVTGDLRDTRAEFGAGAVLQLRTRNGRLRAEAPGEVSIEAERGTTEIIDPAGPVSLKTDYARMDIRGSGGAVNVTGEGGIIDLREIAHPLTIDAERLTVNAELRSPAPTTIAVEDDTVEVTLPRERGVQLEASITDGTLRVPDGLPRTRTDRTEAVSATVAGGGPLVKVTVNRGELRIRTRAATGT